jgi:glycosyltransferase involved in cell wall biosynthesis
VTFDVDDLVFLPSMLEHVPFLDGLTARQRETMQQEARLQELMLGLVDRCTAATSPLVDVLREVTQVPCQVLPNGVSPIGLRAASSVRPRAGDGRLRLGYFAGSATHDEDWAVVESALPDLLARHEHVDLVVVGPLRTGSGLEPWAHRIHRVRPVLWPRLPQLIADVDVNLAPLAVTPFTEGKSALKWVEAAVVGTPTVATSTTPFREAVRDGVTGVLVAPGEDWLPVLESLVVDADRRHAIAQAARDAVLEQFGPQVQADRYETFVRAAIDGPRRDLAAGAWDAARRAAPRSHGFGSLLEDYPFDSAPPQLRVPAPSAAAPLAAARRLTRRL